MKDSGVEWIGEIPEEWHKNKLLRIFNIIGSGTTPKVGTFSDAVKTIPWLQSGDLKRRFITEGATFISAKTLEFTSALKVYNPPFIAIAMYGASIGNISVSQIEACVNQACCVLADPNSCLAYWYYALQSARDYFIYMGEGGGQANISQEKVRQLKVPVPCDEEQLRIANFLDTQTAEIDASIAKTQESIEEYKKLKQAVITQAVTKGIRPGRVMKDSGVEWIGEIPEEWELRKLKYAVSVRNEKSHFSPSSGLYIGLENLGSMRSDITPSDSQYDEGDYASCESGDVLYSKLRPYLCKCIISPVGACCTGEFLVIKSFVGLKEYLRYYLLGTEWTKNVTASTYGAKMPRANETFILNQMCLIPSVEEQQEIAAYLDEKCAAIDTLIEKKQAIITELEAYKKSLIYEYVTGKKEVPVASC